jgi:pimeloyl-ACP methyl ester carboxylesterase
MSENLVKKVCTDRFEMEYTRVGSGPVPVVVIPGLLIKSIVHSAASLPVPYKVFKEDFSLYFFDRKKDAAPGYSLQEMADDQAEALRALGLTDVTVYGVSQGGMIAQYMAIRHPELVNRLVLGSSTSRAEPLQLEAVGNWARLAERHDASTLVETFIRDCFSERFATRYARALKAMYGDVSEAEMDRFAVFAHACDFVDTYDDLGKIKCPVLVLGAGKDRVTTSEAAVKMAEKMKAEGVDCELFMYEEYGHAVFDELPEYKQRIFEFLKR